LFTFTKLILISFSCFSLHSEKEDTTQKRNDVQNSFRIFMEFSKQVTPSANIPCSTMKRDNWLKIYIKHSKNSLGVFELENHMVTQFSLQKHKGGSFLNIFNGNLIWPLILKKIFLHRKTRYVINSSIFLSCFSLGTCIDVKTLRKKL